MMAFHLYLRHAYYAIIYFATLITLCRCRRHATLMIIFFYFAAADFFAMIDAFFDIFSLLIRRRDTPPLSLSAAYCRDDYAMSAMMILMRGDADALMALPLMMLISIAAADDVSPLSMFLCRLMLLLPPLLPCRWRRYECRHAAFRCSLLMLMR